MVVIVIAIVASMLLLASVVYAQMRQHSAQDLMGQMSLLLDQTQRQTQLFIDNTIANTKLFSSSNLMDRYVMVESEEERYDLMQPALLRLFYKYQNAYPEYREIRLLLPDGYEDTRLARPGLRNLTEEEYETPYFQRILQGANTNSVTTILENPDDGTPTLLTSVPIYRRNLNTTAIGAKPALRGFMIVTANLSVLDGLLKTQRIGSGGYLVAVNRSNRIIFHPDDSMRGKDASVLVNPVTESGAISSNPATEGETVTTYFQGEPVYVAKRWLHPDLLLMSVVPKTEFKALSQRIAFSVALVSIGAIAVISTILFLLLRTMVVMPMRQLRHSAIAIGEGRNACVSDRNLQRNDEIGDLARSFQDMHKKLGRSMDELQQSHAEIEHLAYRDSLTGLPNRRLFLELVNHAINNSSGLALHSAVLFLDLDDFKRVNDTLGHEAGDELLRAVAHRLSECLRENDIIIQDATTNDQSKGTGLIARLGGDEFIILINDLSSASDARIIATRILTSLEQPFILLEQEFVVGTSIGIAAYPDNGTNVEALIKCADTAMYEAKRQNKNTYRFYGDEMLQDIQARLDLERDLRIAVNERAFTLNFQPQYDTHTKLITGAEVLLRWHHPVRGNIPPDQFIPTTEEMGLIGPLGEWIIDEACRQWSLWDQSGIAPSRIAVNVSQRQFSLSNLVDVIDNSLSAHNMSASSLELEITESCIMEAPAEVVDTINIIRNNGVRIAMDDFGTGYSSLSALTSLPIDILKIDRSFITGVETGKANEKIVSAILSLAQNLNLEVVAEGVETHSEHLYLLDKKCDVCQGYFFSKPLSAKHMTELLKQEQIKLNDGSYKRVG